MAIKVGLGYQTRCRRRQHERTCRLHCRWRHGIFTRRVESTGLLCGDSRYFAGLVGHYGSILQARLLPFHLLCGAFLSAFAGYLGMRIATKANVRTTQAARTSLAQALKVSFTGGTVMGLGVAGLAIIGLGSLFIVFYTMYVNKYRRQCKWRSYGKSA